MNINAIKVIKDLVFKRKPVKRLSTPIVILINMYICIYYSGYEY